MKPTHRVLILALMAASIPAVAGAQTASASIRGAVSWAQDSEEGEVQAPSLVEWGRGYAAGAALGWTFASGLRAEAEFTFLHNPAVAEEGVPIGGSYRDQIYLANVGYEFGRASSRRATPYIAAGIGLVRVVQHQQYVDEGAIVHDEGHWNTLAVQARGGVSIRIAEAAALTVGYRFLRVNANDEQEVSEDGTIGVGALVHHMAEAGLTFRF